MAAAETSCLALRAGRFPCPPTQVARRSPHQKAALLTAIAPVSQILTLAACGTAGILSAERNDVTPHCVALEGRYARDHPSHRPYRERPHGLGGFLRNGAGLSRLPAHEHAARLCGLESARR